MSESAVAENSVKYALTVAEEKRKETGYWIAKTTQEVIAALIGDEYYIGSFGDVWGLSPRVGGGLRVVIPKAMLDEGFARGWLNRQSNGNSWNFSLSTDFSTRVMIALDTAKHKAIRCLLFDLESRDG